jgi:LysM repeat protein
VWTKSACVVLAWGSILVIVVVAAGMSRPARPARANIRIASSTNEVTRPAAVSVAAVFVAAARPAARYVVQPGDTLSGIAARLAVRGGWPALYAANRRVIGPDPGVIHPGAVLVLPGRMALARYTVAAGDNLSAIAAALAVRGGWPALYAANRRVIGPDPGLIRPGTVLAIPRPAALRAPGSSPGRHVSPGPPSGSAAGHRPLPGRTGAPAAVGMPQWLKTTLLAAGLVIGAAFLAEPVLVIRRRRAAARTVPRAVTGAAVGAAAGPGKPSASGIPPAAGPAGPPGDGPPAAGRTRIVVADYAHLVVTCSARDGTVCVLRPPGQDPAAILRAARLVLPEGPYRELAGQLGLPASWPIVLADYDRLVVTCSARDGTVCVLRPPGQDPAAILKAARLVLPEEPYEELAGVLEMSASWPLERGSPGPPG